MRSTAGTLLLSVMLAAGCQRGATPPPVAEKALAAKAGDSPLSSWSQSISCSDPITALKVNKVVAMPVTIRNTGQVTWPSKGRQSVRLSYVWLKADGSVSREGIRTMLMQDLAPGAAITVPAQVESPAQPGEATLRWSMLQEGVGWFIDHGSPGLDLKMRIEP